MEGYVKVTTTGEIPLGEMRAFEVGSDRVLVAHTDKGFFAVLDECSHDSNTLSNGRLESNEIVCPRHGARFDVETGAVKAPPALVPIDTIEIKVEGEDIFVRLPE